MRGRNKPWAKDFINEHQNLLYDKNIYDNREKTLEIGIGKGDFIIANAKANPDKLHIGVEMNTSIFAMAMKKVVNEGLNNVLLLNILAKDLFEYIDECSISSIYLNFSDPWPQNGYRKRRLVHPLHLEVFEKLLLDKGKIYFKTDNLPLFEMGISNFKTRNYDILFLEYDYQLSNDDYMSEYERKFRMMNIPIYRAIAEVDKNKLMPWNEAIK